MKYLRKFTNDAAYEAATLNYPSVSLIENTMEVKYDPLWVDLGLTSGTLWARTNIGAQTEIDYGQYFQWAATTPLHVDVEGETVNPAADWALCPYCTDPIEGSTFSKYTGSDYSTLQTEDDVVASQFAGYRMPTKEEFQELIDETDNEWATINGVNGWKFTNKSDSSKYIFLPTAGKCDGTGWIDGGERGYYWSSSLNISEPIRAYMQSFENGYVGMPSRFRFLGCSIRPVRSANS